TTCLISCGSSLEPVLTQSESQALQESWRLLCPRFPGHEIVERLPCSIDHELNNGCIVNEAEERCLVRNQVERIDQIVERSNNPQHRIMRSLIVFPAMMRTNQTQHCLEIRPIFFKRVFRYRGCFFRCFVEKRL